MTISVVICTANRAATLAKAIQSILDNRESPLEILIIDQSQNSLSQKIVRRLAKQTHFPLHYLRDQGSGLARARNIGWRMAKGTIIAYTDDDAYVDSHWLSAIHASFSSPHFHTGVTGGKVIPTYQVKNPQWEIPAQWQYLLPSLDHGNKISLYQNGSLPPGVNYAILRQILVDTGGFNPKLGVNSRRRLQLTGEDTDMSLKAHYLGYDLVYQPKMICYHPVPLNRQNSSYLTHRLFTEGYTDSYIYLLHHQLTLSEKSDQLKLKSSEVYHNYLHQDCQPRLISQGNRARSWGYLCGLLRFAFLSP